MLTYLVNCDGLSKEKHSYLIRLFNMLAISCYYKLKFYWLNPNINTIYAFRNIFSTHVSNSKHL